MTFIGVLILIFFIVIAIRFDKIKHSFPPNERRKVYLIFSGIAIFGLFLTCRGIPNYSDAPTNNVANQVFSKKKQQSKNNPPPETKKVRTSIEVSQSQYGANWPFTVGKGLLGCINHGEHPYANIQVKSVYFKANGITYAVNGAATDQKIGVDIDPIWKSNPSIPGTKINIGSIIDKGLSLCQ
ncbi:MAG TPA: DUF2511 domain-containing protein [Ignavibacteriaceae bacterium]